MNTSRMRSTFILMSICSAAACGDESPVAPSHLPGLNANLGTTSTCEVVSTADNGPGTLRAQAGDANCATITFAAALDGQTITLAAPTIVLDRPVAIVGPGADKLKITLAENATTRVFNVGTAGDVTISGLTIADIVFAIDAVSTGTGPCSNDWGSRFVGAPICSAGKLSLTEMRFARIKAPMSIGFGGVLSLGPSLEIKRSEFERLVSVSGSVVALGSANIVGSTFINDTTREEGTVVFAGNTASTVDNSTFTGNQSGRAAVFSYGSGPLHLRYNTITGNEAGTTAGVDNWYLESAPITLEGNIIAGNRSNDAWTNLGWVDLAYPGDEYAPRYESRGYNIIGIAAGFDAFAKPGDALGVTSLQLGALAYNGGLTRTMAPSATSPAVNAIPVGAASCGGEISVDQRGATRPKGGKCDVGAFESDFSPITFSGFSSPVSGTALNIATAGRAVPLKWRLTDAAGLPVTNLTSASITVTALACPSSGPVSAVTETGATNAAGLQNLGDGYYQMNWQTQKSWNGTCRRVQLNLPGVSVPTVDFQFR